MTQFFSQPEKNATLQVSPDGNYFRFKWPVDVVPESIYAIIGDTIHNLRSALDLMATDLAQLNGKSRKGVYFPFSENADRLDGMIKSKNFDRAGADCVTLVKSLKPFKDGNPALRGLHDLDVQDKHITLLLADQQIGPVSYQEQRNATGVQVVLSDKYPFQLVFPAGGPFEKERIVPTLHELANLVNGILDDFAACLVARGTSIP